ncbi:hypothetical protein [Labrys sp. KNU-23]|nr:hypothetical protein [Labrys sp. KNU-23]
MAAAKRLERGWRWKSMSANAAMIEPDDIGIAQQKAVALSWKLV